MKVIQVAPYPAREPVSGSQQRIHGLMTGRNPGDHVERFAPSPGETLVGDGAIETFELGENYRERQYRVGRQPVLRAMARIVPGAFSDVDSAFKVLESLRMRVHAPPPLRTVLGDADVAVVEHPWQFAYVADHAGDTALVYSSHNVETEYHRFLGDCAATRPLLGAVERAERRAVSGADLVVTTSRRDADSYRDEFDPDGAYHVTPNAAPRPDPIDDAAADATARSIPDHVPDDAFVCLFVGTAHRPNRVAVEHLLSVATEVDRAEFVVVGTVGSFLDETETPDNVHLSGYVDDLRPYYAVADVAVNPVTTGSGSNVKLPTYFANGLPVLTTPFGARGLPIATGEHCLVGPIEELPDLVAGALDGEYDLDRIGRRARDLIRRELHWEAVSGDLFERLRTL